MPTTRVVIVTSHYNAGANTAVQTFLAHPARKKENIKVVAIVSVASYAINIRGIKNMLHLVKNTGWRFGMKIIGYHAVRSLYTRVTRYTVPDNYRRHFEVAELAERYDIPFLATTNINAPATLAFVEKYKPDYLVSALCMQILRPPLLAVPRVAAINFHPALTQNHRGSFSAFWTLVQGFRRGGATVHLMTPRLDDGAIVIQRRFFVQRSDSMDCLNERAARLGGKLLAKALVKLIRKKQRHATLQRLGRLFTSPDETAVRTFEKKGHRVFHFKNLFRI